VELLHRISASHHVMVTRTSERRRREEVPNRPFGQEPSFGVGTRVRA
jgi:hypothetical protein